jgi:hypothetical protein
MDLARFLQVAWRYKLLLGLGLGLATVVAVLSFARFDPGAGIPPLEPRENDTWLSASTLLVTQDGFPWGRAILDETVPLAGSQDDTGKPETVPRFSDPGRYSGLASLYAELAKADEVQAEVAKDAKPGQYYEAMVVQQPGTSSALPMIYIKGYGPSPESAIDVAGRASKAFIDYIEKEQRRNDISSEKRVEVVVTKEATTPEIFEKRSFVRPIMMFLLISMVFLALAFALENLRSRPPAKEGPAGVDDWEELWQAPQAEPLPDRRPV